MVDTGLRIRINPIRLAHFLLPTLQFPFPIPILSPAVRHLYRSMELVIPPCSRALIFKEPSYLVSERYLPNIFQEVQSGFSCVFILQPLDITCCPQMVTFLKETVSITSKCSSRCIKNRICLTNQNKWNKPTVI
ncbi:unnamed protein product [Lepidochelys kempii]